MKLQEFQTKHQNLIHKFFLLGVFVLLILPIFLPLPLGWATLAAFVVLTYILRDIATNTYNKTPNKTYEEQTELYHDLVQYIDEKGAKEAVILQYSNRMANSVLRKLVEKGASVTVYVKNPLTAISQMQANRIAINLKEIRGELDGVLHTRVIVHGYDVPASCRAVSIDGKVLAIGWYTYEYPESPDPNYPDDSVEVSGHDVPGMLLFTGTTDHTIFNGMFMHLIRNFESHIKSNDVKPLLEFP